MNKDIDERMTPKGEYVDALNVEVRTSEGSNVGTVQTLKGNTAITGIDTVYDHFTQATCVGTIANDRTNKIYWLVGDLGANKNASATQVDFQTQSGDDGDGSKKDITHQVYSDYIMEYDEQTSEVNFIAVEHYKVETVISNNSHSGGGHLHISDLDTPQSTYFNGTTVSAGSGTKEKVHGLQPGMDVFVNGMKTSITKIEHDSAGTWNGWRIFTKHTSSDGGFTNLANVAAGDKVTFVLPPEKRALGFSNFIDQKPSKIITGINIIDDLLFWTDGLTEPKKINIERCRYGSQQGDLSTYPNGTNKFATLLYVNGYKPSSTNARVSTDDSALAGSPQVPLSYRETTVIRKSPTTPLKLTMSNTRQRDVDNDGILTVNSNIDLLAGTGGSPSTSGSSSDFFFNSNGERKTHGQITSALEFPEPMDWEVGNIIEFYPNDDDAGAINEIFVTALVHSIVNNKTFTFEIQSISSDVIKPITIYKAKLKEKDPLFEFKFPRFAYRWKYEDGEYSAYSPFSEVAFLPEDFDYLPKKGFNLGMTNNLRYLLLSGFKPKTMPLDVVEIDILYKESNSPNVYTVETIKSPSKEIKNLNTQDYEGDKGWFGMVQKGETWVESPNTLTTEEVYVSSNEFTGSVGLINGIYYFTLLNDFRNENLRIGDKVTWIDSTLNAALDQPVLVSGFETDVVNGVNITRMSLTSNGAAVTLATAGTSWHAAGVEIDFSRDVAKRPAIYVDNPQGSLEVKSDMIHATLPANQLLRPWDNVPRKALAQEITGNRVVYGNYTHNYDLKDFENNSVKNSFDIRVKKRSNVRDNVQYDAINALRNRNTGATINWWDSENNIVEIPSQPERSLKSLRDYQVGVVYVDEFGRQTPVQTHESGVVKIPKDRANEYNEFRFHLRNNLDLDYTSVDADGNLINQPKKPSWATHYKYYIKENANEYYNLAMDRFYDAKDGNIWLSFPSSERNKVDEETFLILKKQHDSGVFVNEDARYKILAISNEAPIFIKSKIDSFGTVSTTFGTGGEPRYQQQHVDVPDSFFNSGSTFHDSIEAKNRVIRISDNNNMSDYYDVVSIVDLGSKRRITVRKSFGPDMSFTTNDGTNGGTINSGLSIEIGTREIKNLPEFEGRFFVKILKDGTLEKNLLAEAPDKTYITTQVLQLGRMGNILSNKSTWQNLGVGNRWWATREHPEQNMDGVRMPTNGGPLHGVQDNYIDVMQTHGHEGFNHWGITRYNNNFNASTDNLNRARRMTTSGQLFRWKGDTTIYRITQGVEWGMRNYNGSKWASNHSVGIRFHFTPALNSPAGTPDAVGKPHSGYDPRFENTEGTTGGTYQTIQQSSNWSGEWNTNWLNNLNNAHYLRNIEFVEEFTADNSYTSDNPAVWETEPKENIDIDIYNEASETLPIDYEWNPFLNRFVYNTYFNSWNAIDYYNCFSFANGVESNRIRDDYNAPTIDKGPKVSTVLAEQYKQEQRKSGLIYSGIYNSTSGINRLNQFIQAEKITKDISPMYGSIQKLHAKDTNLNILCEDRILGVLADKDALYNADGNTNVVSTNTFLGQVTPYVGDFGISTDPESFASDQYRSYFTDKQRGAVIRLSRDGITPISDAGMADYFEDAFKISNISLIGSYDSNKKLYNLTIKPNAQSSRVSEDDQTIIVSNQSGNNAQSGLVVINTGPVPTPGNALGNWFRYGGLVDNWAIFVESNGTTGSLPTGGSTGMTTPHKRGWAGIYPGSAHPAGIKHGREGAYGANAGLNNPITLYFDRITSGYPGNPSIDSTSNWDALKLELNASGANNVYLYQTYYEQNPGTTFAFQNWPNNWSHAHQPETVYSIQSVNYNTTLQAYEVVVNWLVGYSGYQDTNIFVWSKNSPFYVDDSNSNTTISTNVAGDYSTGRASEYEYNDSYVDITVSFSENSKGWVTFQSFVKECGVSLNNKYFTYRFGELYQHYSNERRNNFYGTDYDSSICAIFNDAPSSVKNFGSINYEGSQAKIIQNLTDGEYYNQASVDGWYADLIETDLETGFIPEFKEKEGKWFNYIRGNKENNLDNLDVKQFLVQGIGVPSSVSTTDEVEASAAEFDLTIRDSGDTD